MPFFDPIESGFYASCLENLLADPRLRPVLADGLVELGAGTGIPMIEALRRQESTVAVRGFERDEHAHRVAVGVIEKGPQSPGQPAAHGKAEVGQPESGPGPQPSAEGGAHREDQSRGTPCGERTGWSRGELGQGGEDDTAG